MAALAEREHYVVVGVDCTPASGVLLRWADREAMLIGARLVAVTGWRINLPGLDVASSAVEVEKRTRRVLAKTIRAALTPTRARAVRRRVVDLAPADALVVESIRADLLVVGPRSANPISGLLLGSVTEQVITQANCPVAVVHNADLHRTHRIVVGLDGSDASRRALTWAAEQAKLTKSTVEAIVAWEWIPQYAVYPYGPDDATFEKAAQQLLDQELARLPPETASAFQGRVAHGHPAKVLLDASTGSDALVVGNNRARVTMGRILGSVSQKVARHATVPVIVVHEHDHPSAATVAQPHQQASEPTQHTAS
jgi:nucleotide-binding universal stress UspA family protein